MVPKKTFNVHLKKASGAFSRLCNIWKSKQYYLKTKIRLYNSSVKAIILYGSECWRSSKRKT